MSTDTATHGAPVVLHETRGQVMRITINRPDQRNAFNRQVVAGISEGIRAAMESGQHRAIVLTAAGDKAFCAGGDLGASADGAPFSVDPANPRNFFIDLYKLIEICELPIIARVNGHALAGGLGLMAACDIVIAADHALFGVPEAKVGIFPMMIMPVLLRTLPVKKLIEMCMTAEPINAAEAKAYGLINHVVPLAELDARTDAMVEKICANSPTAIKLGKHGFHAMRDMNIRQAWEFAELMLPTMARTQDAREGFAAFREKRRAEWPGA